MNKFLLAAFALLLAAAPVAEAAEVTAKGKGAAPYEGGFFSDGPPPEAKRQAIEAAKRSAWSRYTAGFNAAKLRSYKAMEPEFLGALDDYILDYTVVDEFSDEKSKTYNVIIRMSVNGTAVDAKLSASSAAGAQMGEGSYFSFIFLAREVASRTEFLAKNTQINTSENRVAAEESIASAGGVTTSGVSSQSAQKTVSGGSVQRKSDKVAYRAASSSDINAAMSEQLTVAGFEVVEYADVVSACGGAEPATIATEFSVADDLSRQTRNLAIQGARECNVSFFATGTMDVGVSDIDPVTGLKRVYVSVRGQVWNIAKRLPRKVASVGPVQFAGNGPDATVAMRNALRLAGEKAGAMIVDQMNMKNLR